MNQKNIPLLPLFADFMKKYPKYALRHRNGKPISNSLLLNYKSVYKNLQSWQSATEKPITIPIVNGKSVREIRRVNRTWEIFYRAFTKHLHSKQVMDNYIGLQIKILRTCCTWASKDKNLNLGNYREYLHIPTEEIPIITLSMEQLSLLLNKDFIGSIHPSLQTTARLLVFGCCVGLRYSDLESLTSRNIENRDGAVYLAQRSKKTLTQTRIKLPTFALDILSSFKNKHPRLLPYPTKHQFNNNIKALGEAAGWTEEVGKTRMRGGRRIELQKTNGELYRFCDLLSSHVMRKTAITTLLINGMPEHLVRKISGHAANSSEFYRYVQYSQSYVDDHTEMVFNKISNYPIVKK
jgi:integrase